VRGAPRAHFARTLPSGLSYGVAKESIVCACASVGAVFLCFCVDLRVVLQVLAEEADPTLKPGEHLLHLVAA